jgi:myo-inositol-1(or 4)-monophosphatase
LRLRRTQRKPDFVNELSNTASSLITIMTRAVHKAARGLVRDYGEVENLQVSSKGVSNFVTNADIRAEKTLYEELLKARPKWGFLMEESGEIAGEDPEYRWIIDPLDGTTNFIHALPYFCISVGLERTRPNGKKELVAGVVYDPLRNETFTAEKGKGAYLNNRILRVSGRREMPESLISSYVPRRGATEYQLSLTRLREITRSAVGIRIGGAAALDLAYIAAGRYDGFWHPHLQPWDMAAGMLLVTEAGGLVTDLSGTHTMMETGEVVAGNAFIQPKLRRVLARGSKRHEEALAAGNVSLETENEAGLPEGEDDGQ